MAITYELVNHESGFHIEIPCENKFKDIVSALRKIDGCIIDSIHSFMSIITDDCYGRFYIDGYGFDIDTVFSEFYVFIPHDAEVPKSVYLKIENSFSNYSRPWYKIF